MAFNYNVRLEMKQQIMDLWGVTKNLQVDK